MTQSYNLSQLANKLNTSGQVDATLGLVNATPAANGGTGQSSYTTGDILYASGSTALAKLSDVSTGNVLISGGVGASPSYGKVGLTTHVTGTLPVANGGTGATTFTSNNVLLGNGTGSPLTVAPGASGQVLTSNGTTWTSAALGGIGVGQTWTDVKTSPGRASGTPYTNSTGKPIQVAITTNSSASPSTFLINGSVIANFGGDNNNNGTFQFIVPDSTTYQMNLGSSAALNYWWELR
jgi:hypothetical protein